MSTDANVPVPTSGVDAYDWSFGLFGVSQTTTRGATALTITGDYSPDVRGVFLTGFGLAVVGVILEILMLLAAMPSARPRFVRFAGALGILAPLLVLLAALYLMLSLPGLFGRYAIMPGSSESTRAAISGFWGATISTTNYIGGTVTWSWVWGAGWGWYVAVVGAILLLVGGMFSYFARPGRRR